MLNGFAQLGLNIIDSFALTKQSFPDFELPDDIRKRLEVMDDREPEEDEPHRKSPGQEDADFVESDHPRGQDGKFGTGGGSSEGPSGKGTGETEYQKRRMPGEDRGKKESRRKEDHVKYREDVKKYPNIKSISSEIRASVQDYTGEYYKGVNSYAKTGKAIGIDDETAKKVLKDCSDYIDSNRLIEPITLFRGIPDTLEMKEGDTLPCIGIGSFSSSDVVATNFTEQRENSSIMELVGKKDDPLAPVNGHSLNEDEMEYIMKPGTKMRCIGKTKVDNNWVYKMEVVE
jgi:hypothetical protein